MPKMQEQFSAGAWMAQMLTTKRSPAEFTADMPEMQEQFPAIAMDGAAALGHPRPLRHPGSCPSCMPEMQEQFPVGVWMANMRQNEAQLH